MSGTLTIPFSVSPALSTQWLKDHLPYHLWHEGENPGEIVELVIRQAWDTKKKTTVLYELSLRGDDDRIQQQIYVGYQPKEKSLVEEYQALLNQANTRPPLGRAVSLVTEANLILVAFPNDRKMRLLSENELQAWVGEHLSHISGNQLDGHTWQILETKLEVLRYIPDKRFTIRCWVLAEGSNGVKREFSFIGKQFSDATKARNLYRNLVSLRSVRAGKQVGLLAITNRQVESNKAVRVPCDIALDKTRALVVMEDLPGLNLKDILGEVNLQRVMPAVGELLTRFHRVKKVVPTQVSRKSELQEVRSTLDIISTALPPMRPSPEKLFEKFRNLSWLNDVPSVLLHGSYRLNHLLLHNDELALLDLDSLRMGHPGYDLANFLSSLYYFEIQGQMNASTRKDISRFFLEGYARTTPWNIPPITVLWYLASLLINKQAHKYVTHFHEDQKSKVGQVLALAGSALERAVHMPNDVMLDGLWRVLP